MVKALRVLLVILAFPVLVGLFLLSWILELIEVFD